MTRDKLIEKLNELGILPKWYSLCDDSIDGYRMQKVGSTTWRVYLLEYSRGDIVFEGFFNSEEDGYDCIYKEFSFHPEAYRT